MTNGQEILTELLQQAADGYEGAVEKFFSALLESRIFIPLQPGLEKAHTLSQVGEGKEHLTSLGYATVEYQGTVTLPIFTEERFISEWAEAETTAAEAEFKKILWLMGDDAWMYLNPSQEVGKEITPWEIEQLKRGVEAIPDLAAALREETDETFVIDSASDLYPDLKERLLPILEIYPELEEAFLVSMKEGDQGEPKPALGVKYGKITDAKRVYLRAEIENASREHLAGNEQLFFVDDLGNENSPNWTVFAEATPFYIAQKESAAGKPASLLDRVKLGLRGMFRRKG